ncbi:MAG: type VI secretion system-associated FHA domain protein TagH [Methylomonas sp.]|jgi:type VI secretion system FHA domain protein|uniref:type VI secretion system-associated FHA domain protein TagH n=1 Tax=Methylomonas sp. TaxID=418 RepID=UPI0025D6DAEF|nr:type VI secretion system-associated FHA domain protein TagH [Methylomonas sp.]MCK9608281.1 type VI secretion system-associated FHA domain protein TagH [Methylomonas sp.]
MVLILRVLTYKGLPSDQPISAQFDGQGGSIGRAPNNQLVLPDPEKFISRVHASIICEAGRYFIEDSSTGGTYINDSEIPLQQSKAPLSDGEKIRIGEYELLATIAESATAGFAVNIEQPVRQLDLAQNSVLDGPFVPAQSDVSQPKADFFSSFVEQPESSAIHQSFTPPQIAETPGSAAVDDLDFGDLLSKLDELPGINSPAGSKQSADLPPLPADFFAEEQPKPEEASPFEFATEEAETPWQPSNETPTEEPQVPPFDMPEPAPTTFQEPAIEAVFPAQPVDRSEIVEPKKSTAQPTPAVSAAADDALLREFLAGAGISDSHFMPPEQWPALMRTSGELLRSMVQGLMQVLRARAELKSQFRVSVTTMRSVDNNPLKFTPNVDDAIKLILAPTNPGFLPPKQAVSEGFNDIMNHQIAMTAGIQAALAEILRSFDPQRIEKTQAEGVLFQKKTKCWEYYVEKYPQLKAVAQEEFFGDAFADAYEKQMLLLSRAAKN